MPISKSFLPDVNVWLALASPRHIHSELCNRWLEATNPDDLAFCRISQMGLLRLLTSKPVMGEDVLSSKEAWRAYRTITLDTRISMVEEPLALEVHWRKLSSYDRPTPKLWTDSYLAAFAYITNLRLVTLDQAMLALNNEALILKPPDLN